MDFNWINVGNLVVIMCLIAINVIAVRKKVSESFCSKYPVINIFEQIGRYGSMAFMIFPAFTKGWKFGFTGKLNMGNSVRAVIDRKQWFVTALFVFMELLDFLSRSGKERL